MIPLSHRFKETIWTRATRSGFSPARSCVEPSNASSMAIWKPERPCSVLGRQSHQHPDGSAEDRRRTLRAGFETLAQTFIRHFQYSIPKGFVPQIPSDFHRARQQASAAAITTEEF